MSDHQSMLQRASKELTCETANSATFSGSKVSDFGRLDNYLSSLNLRLPSAMIFFVVGEGILLELL